MRLVIALLLALASSAFAQVVGKVGTYSVSVTSQPRVVPVGPAKLQIEIRDAHGMPADGLTVRGIARMPGMFMGEREQAASPVAGSPGTYSLPASFPMGGEYEVELKIEGQTAVLRMSTGQDTGSGGGGFPWVRLLPWIVGLAIAVFVVVRMRQDGQSLNIRALFTKGTLGGVLLLGVMLLGAIWAVNNLRRPGAMTPLEAQVMEMNTPAPPGTTAVELAMVEMGPLRETVRYSGQAVGFSVQDVNPRVTGTLVSIPVYVGDRVKKGQILAQLDTTQLDPQVAERAAMTDMAVRGLGVSSAEYQTALQEVNEARADLSVKESMVAEANALVEAAREDRRAAEADLLASTAEVGSAEAELSSAEQAATYAAAQLERNRALLADGFISKAAFQQSEADNADAQAKLRQARSAIQRTKAMADSARANVRKADAMLLAAERKVKQAAAEVRAAKATIQSRQSAAEAAKQAIARERAAVAQAQAGYQGAATQKGYATLRAEVDGVVTERLVSPGTVVNPGQTVLRVAQTAPLRIQANVPTSDLSRIRAGTWATVVPAAGSAGKEIRAKVSAIAPGVDPSSRQGLVEILWSNTGGELIPGAFVSLRIEVGEGGAGLTVPLNAVQRPPGSANPFVWVASPAQDKGRFTVRRVEVQLGPDDGKRIQIVEGLKEGQQVVVVGGTYLREGGEVTARTEDEPSEGPRVEVSASGFSPDSVEVEVGKPVTITFIRVSEEGCGTEVVFPALKIEKPLPLNKPVQVTFTPEKAGELKFACGMDMMTGKVIVR